MDQNEYKPETLMAHFANYEDYELGCFLLAGSEVYRLLDTQE